MWPIHNFISSCTERNEHYLFVSGEEYKSQQFSHFNRLVNKSNLLHFVITYHDVVLLDCSTTRIVSWMPILFITIRFIFTKEAKVMFNILTIYVYSCPYWIFAIKVNGGRCFLFHEATSEIVTKFITILYTGLPTRLTYILYAAADLWRTASHTAFCPLRCDEQHV